MHDIEVLLGVYFVEKLRFRGWQNFFSFSEAINIFGYEGAPIEAENPSGSC